MDHDMAEDSKTTRPEEADLVFNIVWTGTTFGTLHPFATSLLDQSQARFRFVANACPADEVNAMRRYADGAGDRVVEVFEVSSEDMLRHGTALDRVLDERDDGEHFCFIDPDILARGPWVPTLAATLTEHSATTSGRELWSDHNVRPADHPGVNGEYFFDVDGFTFGSPHLAAYQRDVILATRQRWHVGFGATGNDLTAETRRHLDEAGRGYWVYDTAKVMNILLQLDGHSLVHQENDQILHIGGVAHYLAPPSTAPAAAARTPRWGEGPDWGETPAMRARHGLASYTANLMTSLAAGLPAGDLPATTNPAMQARYALVRDALIALFDNPGAR